MGEARPESPSLIVFAHAVATPLSGFSLPYDHLGFDHGVHLPADNSCRKSSLGCQHSKREWRGFLSSTPTEALPNENPENSMLATVQGSPRKCLSKFIG